MSSEFHPTRRQVLLSLTGGALSLGSHPADPVAWVVAADRGEAYDEAQAALRAELPGVGWRTFTADALPASGSEHPPRLVITLGSAAYRSVLERAAADAALVPVPLLAGLLPRASFEAQPARAGAPVTAVWLDPPVDRYLELLRLALPQRRKVGVIYGPTSRALRPALNKAASERGLQLLEAELPGQDLFAALTQVLEEAEVLLALPDNAIYNPGTLNNILIATYRQRVPVLSYAASHVRAGAVLALHTVPAQAGRQLAGVARRMLSDRRVVPAPAASNQWTVGVNTQVARSLGLSVGDPEQLGLAIRRPEARP